MGSSSLRFAETVRVLSATAHGLGLRVAAFRSPPHTPGRDRAVSRPRGEPVVAVRVVGRPFAAVQADLIDGLAVVNGLAALEAEPVRRELWNALARAGEVDGQPTLAAA